MVSPEPGHESRPASTTIPPQIHQTVVDGVPVLWDEIPGDPTATLIFGVGFRDTAVEAAGISHLVEHLVMDRAGRQSARVNATSSCDSTMFFASGSPQARARFLADVCAAVTWVRTVTDEELDVVRRTILAEVGALGTYAMASPFSARYGLTDLGKVAISHGRLLDWTAAEVREVAATWFHRDNAVLTLTTAPWDGLHLPLPEGRTPPRPAPPLERLTSPAAYEHEAADLVFSGTIGGAHTENTRAVAGRILVTSVTDAVRVRLGNAYDVDLGRWAVGDGEIWNVSLDPQAEATPATVSAVLRTLDQLRTSGPGPEDLAHVVAEARDQSRLASWKESDLDSTAVALLRHSSSALPDVAALGEVTVDEVRAVIEDLLRVPLLLLPAGTAANETMDDLLTAAGYGPCPLMNDPEGREPKQILSEMLWGPKGSRIAYLDRPSPLYSGKFFSHARGQEIAVLPDRLVLIGPGQFATMLLGDIVLYGTDSDGDVEIVTSTGAVAVFRPASFRRLPKALAAARQRMPHALFYDKQRIALTAG